MEWEAAPPFRWGGEGIQRYSGEGGTNALAGGIRLFETVWATKQSGAGAAIPAVFRYMYLRQVGDGAFTPLRRTSLTSAI